MTNDEVRNNSLETLMRSSLITEEAVGSATYVALGRRVAVTIHDSPLTIHYYYDGQKVAAEYTYADSSETLRQYYVDGGQYIDEHVVMHDAVASADRYYLTQALYTIAGLVDEDGSALELYTYDAYGDPTMYDGDGVTAIR